MSSAVPPAVPRAVPPAVPRAVPSAGSSVAVNDKAQRGPYVPPTGKSVVPEVPRTSEPGQELMAWQPSYATSGGTGTTMVGGSPGAPSVPVDGFLFRRGPIDVHYQAPQQAYNPYERVNAPATRGFYTIVKAYLNHVFNGRQNVDNAGWQQSSPQQRTSYMRFQPPPAADGYSPESYIPRQLPQQPNTYKFGPVTGNDQPGPRPGQGLVLNSTTFGAGQTAGGIGGNQYTPAPGPPDTTPAQSGSSGMPVWG